MEDVGRLEFYEEKSRAGGLAQGWISLGGRLFGQPRLGPVSDAMTYLTNHPGSGLQKVMS